MDFKGKTVIVTGSSRGIGKAIAEAFAAKGATICILDLMEEGVNSILSEFTEKGYNCLGFVGNVTDSEKISEIFKEIYQKTGSIDVLVNNAGITKDKLILKMKEADWDAVLDVNLKGTFICIQKASRYMMKQPGSSIINLASVIGLIGNTGQANYAASKAGIIGLTKSVAKEFAAREMRCNAIAPGFIRTEMTENLPPEVVSSYAEAIPLKRMGTPQDIADLCLFLASDMSSYITGQVINVDGGLVMQ
ncbi:MAG: 3-oxoacyl-[acyl-carrier-protein] reductase [Candidatus Cloacimonetes bacterium]|nr:3-oxoacyl-[acyl-carrier-protein] reductase [Candidatus Cloacimonadota bacterium]